MALQDVLNTATRRRNMKPVSSIIRADLTRDVDCSAMAQPPEDGEFIMVLGDVGSTSALELFNSHSGGAADATDGQGLALKMVWSSAMRSDRQAIGETRVPVMSHIGDIEVETSAYNYTDGGGTLQVQYPLGSFVSVESLNINGAPALEGTALRMFPSPTVDNVTGYMVGVVTGYGPGHGSIDIGSLGTGGTLSNINAKLRFKLFGTARKNVIV